MEISGDGSHRPMVDALYKNMMKGNTTYPPPSVIAQAFNGAISEQQPRTPYVAGSMGKTLIRMRRLLGAHGFDKTLHKQMLAS